MEIAYILKQALARSLDAAGIKVSADDVALERPKELLHGDYASGVALAYAKQTGVAPLPLAERIVASLGKFSGVARIEAVKPGFINFYLAQDAINGILAQAISDEEAWGRNESQKDVRVMVEYTDPNHFKEFHIGHLMSNAIGESIARLIESSGAEGKRANYQGDGG